MDNNIIPGNAFASYLNLVKPEFLNMDIKQLKRTLDNAKNIIKNKINDEKDKNYSLTKEQKKQVRDYKELLEETLGMAVYNDHYDDAKQFLELLPKLATNTSGKEPFLRIHELKVLLRVLSRPTIELDDLQYNDTVAALIVLTHC